MVIWPTAWRQSSYRDSEGAVFTRTVCRNCAAWRFYGRHEARPCGVDHNFSSRLTDDIGDRYNLALRLMELGRKTEAARELRQVLWYPVDLPGQELIVQEARALLRELEPQPR